MQKQLEQLEQLELLEKVALAKVLVVGDVMLDRYWYGNTNRISPEAPIPVVHVDRRQDRLGGAGNVALNIATLGSTVSLLGVCGYDSEGDILENKLTLAGIEHRLQRLSEFPTITKLRVISRNQQVLRLDFEQLGMQLDSQILFDQYQCILSQSRVVVLSDYAKGTLSNPSRYISLARQLGIPVLVDPKGKDFEHYRGATIVTPNRREFEAVVGCCRDEDELVNKGQAALNTYDLSALLITRSEHGMTLLQRDKAPLHLPARTREVYDVTGAGDTVISMLAVCLAVGGSLSEAINIANVSAGIAVSRLGTVSVTIPELRRELRSTQEQGNSMLSEEQLSQVVADAHAHGEKIVMTNGCFDILHAGHISYLKQAKSLGQRLIIAINDDESVKRLKGSNRPINSLEQRAVVLVALEFVDWVVSFSEDTPERLIQRILPDTLVKGGDYRVEDIAGAQAVLANGGEVKILNFVPGCSTTNVLQSLEIE